MLRIETNAILNDRYILERRIGSGGFSVVWKAKDEKAGGMPVAIKIFMPDKGLDDSLISMFRDEFELTRYLDDNRLVKMTDYFVADESPCLVMPYMPGGSLYQKLQEERELPEREIARILYQVCGALNYLHSQEKPFLHLDIKPENILIDYSGNYLLADFGISLKMRSSLIRASNTKGGTFAYSPPELSESRKLTSGSDIFSLGVMLFELSTGALPWSGMGGNAVVIGMPLPELPENYTNRLQEFMHACMSRYPQNRPTAIQLEEAARKFLDRGYWDVKPNANSFNQSTKVPTSTENLQKAIDAGVIYEFIKRTNGETTVQECDELFYYLNKQYGAIKHEDFNNAIKGSIKINSRETQPVQRTKTGASGTAGSGSSHDIWIKKYEENVKRAKQYQEKLPRKYRIITGLSVVTSLILSTIAGGRGLGVHILTFFLLFLVAWAILFWILPPYNFKS